LKKDKIDFLGTYSKNMSGYSIILDSIANDRTILTYKGSNNDFRFTDINKRKLKTKWFYMCAMVEHSFEEPEKAVIFAKSKGMKVLFNPSSYLAEKGKEYLEKLLTNTDILVLNKEEARDIVGNHEPEQLLRQLKDQTGIKIVVITDGKEGVYVNDGKYIYRALAHPIKIVETTGAGDAFGSTFLAGLLKKNDIEFAIKIAITNSESVISHHGAKTNLLRWSKALQILKKNPVIIKKKKL
jgi:ribokinase